MLALVALSWIIPQDDLFTDPYGSSLTDSVPTEDAETVTTTRPTKPIDTSPIITPYQNGYCYTQLSPTEQTNYQFLLNSLIYSSGMPTTLDDGADGLQVALPKPVGTLEEVHHLFYALHTDHPEIFYLCEQYGYLSDGTEYPAVIFYYSYPYNERVSKAKELQAEIDKLVAQAASLPLDYDKELFFRERILERCHYNDLASETLYSNKELYERSSSAYAAICGGLPICGGYARGMQLLLNAAGIQATTVVNDDHRWNMVWIEGEPYHLDITWDERFIGERLNHYVNLTDWDISLSREYPVQRIPLPEATATANNYHRKNGFFFESTFDGLDSCIVRQLCSGTDDHIELRFKGVTSIGFVELYINTGLISELAAQTGDPYIAARWSDYQYYHDKTLGAITIIPTGEVFTE